MAPPPPLPRSFTQLVLSVCSYEDPIKDLVHLGSIKDLVHLGPIKDLGILVLLRIQCSGMPRLNVACGIFILSCTTD